jgi:hypothetical protein
MSAGKFARSYGKRGLAQSALGADQLARLHVGGKPLET